MRTYSHAMKYMFSNNHKLLILSKFTILIVSLYMSRYTYCLISAHLLRHSVRSIQRWIDLLGLVIVITIYTAT